MKLKTKKGGREERRGVEEKRNSREKGVTKGKDGSG